MTTEHATLGEFAAREQEQATPPIVLEGVAKSYELISSPGKRLLRLLLPGAVKAEQFDALHRLDLKISRGEFFGIIGQNGSGKSTLLQIISGIIPPSAGSVTTRGRVAALLELGAGFNPEFTGRENARLNAQILGVGEDDFKRLLPEIERFADIGAFIDQPVKTYSSGMFVRLAFAVQACIDPEILIIDEALAVGDVFFRLKCYERLARLREKGCTVILVTHSMEDVIHYCDRVLLLHRGKAMYCGEATTAVNRYYALGRSGAGSDTGTSAGLARDEEGTEHGTTAVRWPSDGILSMTDREQVADDAVACTRVAICSPEGVAKTVFRQHETARIMAEFAVMMDLQTPAAGVVLRSDKGVIVHGRHTGQSDAPVPRRVAAGTRIVAWHDVSLDVGVGEYVVDVGLASWPEEIYAARRRVSAAELEALAQRHCVATAVAHLSVIPKGDMGFDAQPFYGIAGIDSHSNLAVEEQNAREGA